MKNIAVVGSVKIAVIKAVLVIYQIIKIRFYMKVYVIFYNFTDNFISNVREYCCAKFKA
jgi:hypothetical protein